MIEVRDIYATNRPGIIVIGSGTACWMELARQTRQREAGFYLVGPGCRLRLFYPAATYQPALPCSDMALHCVQRCDGGHLLYHLDAGL